MSAILLAIIATLAAGAFFVWLVRTMLEKRCPLCTARSQESMLIPVIPGVRFWCLACGEVFPAEEAVTEAAGEGESQSAAPREAAPEPPQEPQAVKTTAAAAEEREDAERPRLDFG